MLGTLAKYIFGGMMSDAPEASAPEMQYHTREVNDWLLVDMPDQAIDDEDIDSESDDDEILTALPLLLAEEVNMQSIQIVQSYEEVNSACDNSSDKIQRHFDKIHSVPSGVQHHSGDKNQGNFVDKVEAISVELEDDIPTKIQDVSIPVKVICDNTAQDDVQICNNSFHASFSGGVQKSYAMVLKNSIDRNQYVSSKLQDNYSCDEIICKSNSKLEDFCVEDDFHSEIRYDSALAQEVSNNTIQAKSDPHINDIPVQTNYSKDKGQPSYDMDVEDFKNRNQFALLKLNSNSAGEINCNPAKNIAEQTSAAETDNNFADETKNVTEEVQKVDVDEVNKDINNDAQDFDEIFPASTEIQKVSDDTFISNFVDQVESNTEDEDYLLGSMYDIFSEDQYTNDKINAASKAGEINLDDQNGSKDITRENSNAKQCILSQEQAKSHQQRNYTNELKSNDQIQDNLISGRRLYSHVVQGYNDSVQAESKNTDGKIISNFVDKVEPVFVEVTDTFSSNIQDVLSKAQNNDKMQVLFVTELDRLYDQYVINMETKENLNRMQAIAIQGQKKLYNECDFGGQLQHSNYKIQDNFSCGRKLYSDVVRDCNNRDQEKFNEPIAFSHMALEKYVQMKYRFIHDAKMSDDEDPEISDDDETDESSADEMHESSDADIDESSDADIEDLSDAEIEESAFDRLDRKTYEIVSQFYFAQNEEYSEEEIREFQKCFEHAASRKKITNRNESCSGGLERDQNVVDKFLHTKQRLQLVPKHFIEFMPLAERLVDVPDFLAVPQCWYAYQMWNSYNHACPSSLPACVPTSFGQDCDSFEIDDEYKSLFEDEEFLEEKSPTSTLIVYPSSAELLQNLIYQKSTAQPKKTAIAYVKEQIKELKPMQQAIQFDNRKYMTRSQFNRQNRNYMYQSSVKTNRRRNLQRNHSGANNNRKC